MIKSLGYLFFSGCVALLLAVFTSITIPDPVVTTLYTVAGVVFSIGMSIAIAPKTDGVTNTGKRGAIRNSYKRVRNAFMCMFAVDTLVFISAELLKNSKLEIFMGITCALYLLISILYFTLNFIELQRLGKEIEDQILREKET